MSAVKIFGLQDIHRQCRYSAYICTNSILNEYQLCLLIKIFSTLKCQTLGASAINVTFQFKILQNAENMFPNVQHDFPAGHSACFGVVGGSFIPWGNETLNKLFAGFLYIINDKYDMMAVLASYRHLFVM